MSDDESWRRGGCQCGRVRYELRGEPLEVYVCHCRECRKQSASAFGISVIVPPAALRLIRGAVKVFTRPTDSGGRLDCAFCSDCGSRLWHATPDPDRPLSVKGGSLDDPIDLTKAAHIWTSRMLPGVVPPEGALRYPGEPPA